MAADQRSIAATLGAAFVDDPVLLWLMGRRRATPQRTARVHGGLAAVHVEDGTCTMTADGNAVAVWAAPKHFKLPIRRLLPHIPGMVRGLGPAGLVRGARMAEVEHLHPPEPHWYLAVLGTHPDHQGRGLASAAMAPTLARADAEGVACYLESSKESNIPFYARHGFEVTGTHDIAAGTGPRLWLMWREPQGPEPG